MTQNSAAECTVTRCYRGQSCERIWTAVGLLMKDQQLFTMMVKRQDPALGGFRTGEVLPV